MCGVSGCFFFNNKNNYLNSLKEVTNDIIHRGPDNIGFWSSQKDGIYLGHTRLSILDLSEKGNQPMKSLCGRYIISYNGEIYNFKKKTNELNKSGIRLDNGTDTAVLLELIVQYGLTDAIRMIEGMFAFALWDNKLKKLFLVRDRFGEKPLFYCKTNELVIFGSELKIIKNQSLFNLEISQKASFYYSLLGYIPAPFTIYENVFKVMPSQIIEIDKFKNFEKSKYYSFRNISTEEEGNYLSFKKKIKKSLNNSIKKMMIADVEVGCFLSGGVDSSLVAYLMQKNSEKKISTFSVGFNEKEYDESTYARQISDSIGSNHHQLMVSSMDMLDNLESIINIFDEPFSDSSFIPTFLISKLASSHVKVVLSGDGGDEMFLGYNRYIVANKILKIKKYFSSFFRKAFSKCLNNVPSYFYDTLSKPFQKMFGLQAFSHKVQKIANILNYENNSDFYLKLNIFDNDLLDSFSKSENLFKEYENLSLIDSLQANDIDFYLSNDILVKVDRSSMFNSLEIRSPFLDHKLVENAFEAPLQFKIRKNSSKYILKDILADYTFKKFAFRPKMGFAIPIDRWIKDKKFQTRISEIFYESEWSKLGYDKKKLIEKWEKFKKYKSITPQYIWMYTVAGMWLQSIKK